MNGTEVSHCSSTRQKIGRAFLCIFLAVALMFVFATPANAGTYQRGLKTTKYPPNIIGTNVKLSSYVLYTCSNNKLTTPKALWSNVSTSLFCSYTGGSQGWRYYTTSPGGSGLASFTAYFKHGIPTPWGTVGGSVSITQIHYVYSNGLWRCAWY
jgi:hypothetical protein